MKSIILLITTSLLISISCGNHNLPFIGTKYCSEASGVNFKIDITKDGKTKITLAGATGLTSVEYDGKFKDTIDESFIIKKTYCLYIQDKWTDTLQYINEANW